MGALRLTGKPSDEERKAAKGRLVNREVRFIFAADIPEVMWVLAKARGWTLEQLGRGMRLSPNKESWMVFDFVNNARQYNTPYSKLEPRSDKEKESLARFFLGIHKEQQTDYTAKFREALETPVQQPAAKTAFKQETADPETKAEQQLLCPKCGAIMVKRKATKGPNAGKEFYGCSNYPKCRCIINLQ